MDKKYINGLFIKTVGEYEDLSVSIRTDEFIKEIKEIDNNGWANILIKKRKTPSDKGITHYVIENTWRPRSTNDDIDSEQF